MVPHLARVIVVIITSPDTLPMSCPSNAGVDAWASNGPTLAARQARWPSSPSTLREAERDDVNAGHR